MRQGEACHLGRGDVDLEAGTLVSADSKFGKSRLVFLHPTAVTARRANEKARDEAFPEPEAVTFLVKPRGAAGQAQHPQDVRRAGHGGGHPGPARAARLAAYVESARGAVLVLPPARF